MNLGELRSLVRFHLNEPVAVFWSDSDLNRAINIGRSKVHNLIKNLSQMHYTTRATFVAVAGQSYYGLPADLKDLKLVVKIIAGIETPLDYAPWPDPTVFSPQISSDATGLSPQCYWLVGNAIRIIPPPTQSGAVITTGGGGGAGGAATPNRWQLITTTSRQIHTYRLLGPTGSAIVPIVTVSAGPSFRLYYEARDVNLVADTETPSYDADYHEDLKDIFKERKNDLVGDLLHHLPYPQQEVEAYGSGFF